MVKNIGRAREFVITPSYDFRLNLSLYYHMNTVFRIRFLISVSAHVSADCSNRCSISVPYLEVFVRQPHSYVSSDIHRNPSMILQKHVAFLQVYFTSVYVISV